MASNPRSAWWDLMQTPQQGEGMEETVLEVEGEVEDEEGDRDGEPERR